MYKIVPLKYSTAKCIFLKSIFFVVYCGKSPKNIKQDKKIIETLEIYRNLMLHYARKINLSLLLAYSTINTNNFIENELNTSVNMTITDNF